MRIVDSKSESNDENNVETVEPKESNARKITKDVVHIAVGFGVSAIIGSIVRNNVEPGKLPMRICIRLARVGMSNHITNRAAKPLNELVDKVFDFFENPKSVFGEYVDQFVFESDDKTN